MPSRAPLLAWLVLAGLGAAGGAAGRRERAPKAASWEEVNVLAHGLLQLGHGLREHVERLGGQLRDLSGRLAAHNASLAGLERSAAEQRERLARAHSLFDGRLARLEARLDGTDRAGAQNSSGPAAAAEQDSLQNLVRRQNVRMEELLQKIKQQQFRMEKQNLQIKSLQSKVNTLIPLQRSEKEPQGPRWRVTVPRSAGDGAANQTQAAESRTLESSKLPAGCHDLFLEGQQNSGVFEIQPPGATAFKVFCDMEDGGWTVIQRRSDGSVDFDRLWDAYKDGFGNLTGDFWLGLEKMHRMVKEERYQLLVELRDWEGNAQRAHFLFRLGGEETAYTLSLLGPIRGELESAMGDFPQLPFSTRDRDHDLKGDTNCAKHLSGGWWFSYCGHVNLNGKYFRSIPRQRHERKQGIFWKTWRGRYYPLRSAAMKIRPAEPDRVS
ncbi:angiopoietin-related protein 4 [Pantherophis guttatus]|uniref:Angiopoietin-related protein 4 n=1 Tax=Pantherophis guttatus TaxID=94885 RepID=A0A6P9ASX5_PANGU|nr:angiopoietin-related protein 4 [Pantherophis guttatus]